MTADKSLRRDGGLFQRLVDRASAESGRSIAVIHGDMRLTYSDVVARVIDFSCHLAGFGVQPFEHVAVILHNSVDFLIAAFAIWRRGAVLVPLNPQLREIELHRYLANISVRTIITAMSNAATMETLQKGPRPVDHICFYQKHTDEWLFEHRNMTSASTAMVDLQEAQVGPETPAITQYSTGSTGHPKRVTRTHGQLLGEFCSVSNVLNISSADRVLGIAPFFHSHGLMNSAVLSLLSGGTLYPVENFFVKDVARLIERERITVIPGVPFMFQLLAEAGDSFDFCHLRCALSAGAPLLEKTSDAFRKAYGIGIRELYGSTETGVICIAGEDSAAEPNCVGRPIPGVSVRVVDEGGSAVPEGTTARILVVSPFAASNYDSATASMESYFATGTFFPGDLGRVTSTGEVVLCGRDRGFINVGGNKVDPAEVEAVLLELPLIAEAVVFGVPDGVAGEKLKAVIIAAFGVTKDEIRAHCMRRLAEFKHPKIIEFRQELPKSPLGKVLRKYLVDERLSGEDRYHLDLCSLFRFSSCNTFVPNVDLRLSLLPPFLRVLLVTDGTVTRSLAAYFGELIDVNVLTAIECGSAIAYPKIGVSQGDRIFKRTVTLRGRITREVYVFAESIIVIANITPEMKHELIEYGKGIGEIILERRLESYWELFGVTRAAAAEWAVHLGVQKEASALVRNYGIYLGGRAAVQIQEVFPESRF